MTTAPAVAITAVLDASALLALLRSEPGADRVRTVLPSSAITSANLAEVVGHFARAGIAEVDIRQVLRPLPMDVVPIDEALAYEIGMLIVVTRSVGLSPGDRACLALAKHLGVKAVTADRLWSTIAGSAGIAVDVIR